MQAFHDLNCAGDGGADHPGDLSDLAFRDRRASRVADAFEGPSDQGVQACLGVVVCASASQVQDFPRAHAGEVGGHDQARGGKCVGEFGYVVVSDVLGAPGLAVEPAAGAVDDLAVGCEGIPESLRTPSARGFWRRSQYLLPSSCATWLRLSSGPCSPCVPGNRPRWQAPRPPPPRSVPRAHLMGVIRVRPACVRRGAVRRGTGGGLPDVRGAGPRRRRRPRLAAARRAPAVDG